MSSAPRSISRARRALVILAVAAVSACHRNQTAAGTDESSNEPATIQFANESLTQADVFVASRGSGARRIGTVFAGRTETLTIPSELANRGTIAIVARLLADNRAPSSGTIALGPGAHLSVRLPMDARTLVVLPAQ